MQKTRRKLKSLLTLLYNIITVDIVAYIVTLFKKQNSDYLLLGVFCFFFFSLTLYQKKLPGHFRTSTPHF